jgi:4-hydroxy-3-methylbut-2-en-1-yl diphosphate synthase IspG/GcpE
VVERLRQTGDRRMIKRIEHVIVNVVACDQCGEELTAYDLDRDEVFEMIKDNKWITITEDWTGKHCHYCSVECKELHVSLRRIEHVIVNVVACDQCGDELNAYDLNRDEVFEMIKDNKWITITEDWTGKHCHYCSVECKELHLSLKSCPRCKSDAMIKVEETPEGESKYWPKCMKCEAYGPLVNSIGEAVHWWNDYAKQEKEK